MKCYQLIMKEIKPKDIAKCVNNFLDENCSHLDLGLFRSDKIFWGHFMAEVEYVGEMSFFNIYKKSYSVGVS